MAHMTQNEKGTWYLSDEWHIEDVQSVRDDLDEEQCIEVLDDLANNFDANNGINWNVIEYTANILFPKGD